MKLQKVLRTKAQENATEGAVELDVGDNFAASVIHYAVEEGTRRFLIPFMNVRALGWHSMRRSFG